MRNKIPKIPHSYRPGPGNVVGGRDSPHEVFDPWVRWDLGLDRMRSFSVVVVTGLFQFVYTLILKNSSQGGVPDGADRSKITRYVDIFQKEPTIVLGKCQTTKNKQINIIFLSYLYTRNRAAPRGGIGEDIAYKS